MISSAHLLKALKTKKEERLKKQKILSTACIKKIITLRKNLSPNMQIHNQNDQYNELQICNTKLKVRDNQLEENAKTISALKYVNL